MRIALYQPDIPQNTGSLLRLASCMGVELHIIEPCGFPLDDKKLRRVGMDYVDLATLVRHRSWQAFLDFRQSEHARIILLTTKASTAYTDIAYQPTDILLLGRESAGVPDSVHAVADIRAAIPMHGAARSLNIGMAASMVLGEALRQVRIELGN